MPLWDSIPELSRPTRHKVDLNCTWTSLNPRVVHFLSKRSSNSSPFPRVSVGSDIQEEIDKLMEKPHLWGIPNGKHLPRGFTSTFMNYTWEIWSCKKFHHIKFITIIKKFYFYCFIETCPSRVQKFEIYFIKWPLVGTYRFWSDELTMRPMPNGNILNVKSSFQ